ncbi:hypothetical protein [Fodinicola acaciae]|uniref:hypothetical protein n=1 Tax=Fodinicola acaciae TaxID=2681555 RepID=UPI0013D28A9E|nr:hypothetical protein [Fodinicola acaciae]
MSRATELLEELERLSHPDRRRRIAEVGAGLDRAELPSVIVDLRGHGSRYERQVAVGLAAAAGAVDQLVWAARDPDPVVAKEALARALPVASDDQIGELLPRLAAGHRKAVYRELRRGRRTALADHLLPEVCQWWGDAAAATILPAAGPVTVAEWLPRLGHALGGWSALAGRHPDAVLAYAEAELEGLDDTGRRRWWSRRHQLVAALADHRPSGLLRLLERSLVGELPAAVVGRLLSASAGRTVNLLSQPGRLGTAGWGRWLTRSQARRIAALDDATVIELGRVVRTIDGDQELSGRVLELLAAVAPRRRPAILDGIVAGTEIAAVRLSDGLLDLLPAARRHEETRRTLRLRPVKADPDQAARLTAFLPLPEARRKLTSLTAAADADQRALGYSLLIACAGRGRDRQAFADLLTGLDRLRNDQDKVRGAVVAALNDVPLTMFTQAAADGLTTIRTDALNAADLSGQTWHQLLTLAIRILTEHPDCGPRLVEWVAGTATGRRARAGTGELWDLGGLRHRLRPGQERLLFDAARGHLVAALDRANAAPLMNFAEALGRRGWDIEELPELVELVLSLDQEGMARRAASWLLTSPRDRDHWLEKLLAWDPSVATVAGVFDQLASRRTDLLDKVLFGAPVRGLFRTSGRLWAPVTPYAATHWTTTQQTAYARLLARADLTAADDRWQVAYTRVTLMAGDEPEARQLLTHPDPAVATAALVGLAESRKPAAAMRVIVDLLDGDRSVVATPTMSRLARWMPPDSLATVLAEVLQSATKVTARKEAARLVGHYRVPGALPALADAWDRRNEHRDVRIAIAAAATAYLDDVLAWQLVEQSIADSPDAAIRLLRTDPDRLPVRHRGRFARLLTGLARHPDAKVATVACDCLDRWHAAAPEVAAELAGMVTDLDCPQWRGAARSLVGRGLAAGSDRLLAGMIAELTAATAHDADGERERDAPARQRLHLLGSLVRSAAPLWARRGQPLRAAAEDLRADAEFGWLAVRLLVLDVRFDDENCAAQLGEIADLAKNRPLLAARAAEEVAWMLGSQPSAVDPAAIQPALDRLPGRGDLAGGLVAVELAKYVGARLGWPGQVVSSLRWLRRHPEQDVCAAAWSVFTAGE